MRYWTLSFVAATLSLGSAAADPSREGSPYCKELPSSLSVPAGNVLAFALEAEGVQIYACNASNASYGWVFQAPEARLSEAGGQEAGKHYAGPTWEATDGSKVVGTKVEAATPDATSVPWLLLSAASHTGAGRMEKVTFVQRIGTRGGNAPSDGCDLAHSGAIARVPYRAVYCFYRNGMGARN